jgi:uncharacterized protein YlzI (FlbEa/FlbD family)
MASENIITSRVVRASYVVENQEAEVVNVSVSVDRKVTIQTKTGQDFVFRNSDPALVLRIVELIRAAAKLAQGENLLGVGGVETLNITSP